MFSESFAYANQHGVLLQEDSEQQACLYYRDGADFKAIVEMRRLVKQPITLEKVPPEQFAQLLTKTFEQRGGSARQMVEDIGESIELDKLMDEMPGTEDLLDYEDDAPIIKLLNALFSEAIKQNASDIHFEVFEDELMVRFRIDGILQEMLRPQRVLAPLIISRIKVMAKLDIAEKRIPQDGRISLKIAGHPVDVRVSTMPTAHGERIVLRLLDKKEAHLSLLDLGMGKEDLERIKRLIVKPHGIILVTGPTGSGKTTTLYAALSRLNEVSRNILTVEDPIEYDLPGIGQTQVNTKVDMTFARGLRAMLRQDPDVLMVGEIRDLETANIAVQASLTGHLVLSTLHTNTAVGAVTRLRDMGIDAFLISSSLIGVVAQRLVRVLCKHCRVKKPASARECELLRVLPKKPPTIYHDKGCEACNYLGYRGRTGIYEIIPIDGQLKAMIHEDVGEHDIKAYARQSTPSIREDGIRRVLAGDTTLEEVLRVTSNG